MNSFKVYSPVSLSTFILLKDLYLFTVCVCESVSMHMYMYVCVVLMEARRVCQIPGS